ncbi:MAG: hypothetical protein ACOVOQ_15355 [Flavobacterium sp.]|jgi:hypothetical protein
MILIILTAISASLFINDIHNLPIKWRVNFKPFNCGSCLAAWLGAILYFLPELIQNIAACLFISGFLAPIISRLIWKLWK